MNKDQQLDRLEVNISRQGETGPITDPEEIRRLWDQTFETDNLRLIFNTRVKASKTGLLKKSVGLDFITPAAFERNLEENLQIISRKVKNNTYSFTRFKLVLINKGPGKAPRELRIPTVRDRITITAMADFARKVLGPGCEIPRGRNIISSIIRDRNKYSGFVKTDISGFFKSIPHEQMHELLERKFCHSGIVELFCRCMSTGSLEYPPSAVNNPHTPSSKGIPEGLSFSGFLANSYLENLDHKYSARKDLRYFRFVDDILILTDSSASSGIRKELKEDMAKLELTLSDEKTLNGLMTDQFDYLGYVFDGDLISMREKSIAKVQNGLASFIRDTAVRTNREIAELKQFLKDEKSEGFIKCRKIVCEEAQAAINRRITGFKLGSVYYSWLNYYRLINDLSLLGTLDGMVAKLLRKYGLDQHIKPKKYLKAYNELIHNPDTEYIPDLTGISEFILPTDKNEASEKKYQISLSSELMKEIATVIGWNSEKYRNRPKQFCTEAISCAFSAGFKIEIKDGKLNIDLKELKRKIIRGLSRDIEDNKGV